MAIQNAMLKATYVLLAIVILGLLVTGIIVRNTSIIAGKPHIFLTELFAMSVLTALPLYVFIMTRRLSAKTASKLVLFFAIKLAIMHIFLELSGFYEYIFSGV